MIRQLFSPPSTLWLAAHQVRLGVRVMRARTGAAAWIGYGAAALFYAALCFGLGLGVKTMLSMPHAVDEARLASGALALLIPITGFSVGVMGAFQALTDRGDLDLLLSGPVPPARIARARLIAAAWRSAMIYSLLAGLFVLMPALSGKPQMLLVFPVLGCIALVDSVASHAVVIWLLRRFGLVKGRWISQAIGFVGMIASVAGWQAVRLLAEADLDGIETDAVRWLGGAVLGEPAPALAIMAFGIVVFVVATHFLSKRFADDAAMVAGGGRQVEKAARSQVQGRFARGLFGAVFVKEWRSIARDPMILVQVAVPAVALVLPLGIAMVTGAANAFPDSFVPALAAGLAVLMASQLTSSVAWLAASVEEAADLLRGSPADSRLLLWGKIAAACAPGGAMVLACVPGIAALDLWAGGMALAVGLAGCAAAAAVEFWRPRPARRARMTERPDRSIVSIGLGFVMSVALAATAGLAAGGHVWAAAPAVLSLALLGVARVSAPKAERFGPQPGAPGGPWSRQAAP